MKKLILIALSAVMALLLVACGQSPANSPSQAAEQSESGESLGGNVQIPNPFIDCETLEDAQKAAGFDLTVPDKMPEGYSQSAIRAMENSMIELIYMNGDNEMRIRKATGSEDISGDYNDYIENSTLTVGDLQVTIKGNDGKVNVATWVNGDYAFSLTFSGTGMDKTVVSDMVGGIQ
jgi:hypothetical protein